MKDLVIKATGNSRFLKSAIPEGTTWEDALALLRIGEFPIDLHGVNSAGIEQMGTPLNKANLLTDALAAKMNLDGSATVLTYLNALTNALLLKDASDNKEYIPKWTVTADGFPAVEFTPVE